ncbi:alanine racemase [Arthrobacter sp. Hiyo8]|nr:alanine racemase [Arthrobacter sp. Hiyo8]
MPRVATGGPVRVNGVNYPVVGRIAMDQMVIDLGNAVTDEAGWLGAEAVMFGDGADGGPTADDWAAAAGTNNYEIVTRVSPRVPRIYINETPGRMPGERASIDKTPLSEALWERTVKVATAERTHALGSALAGSLSPVTCWS